MALRLYSAPAAEPLTPAEVRTRLGLGAEVTDGMLTPLIKSARQALDGPDGLLRRALVTQTWNLLYDEFPSEAIQIPLPPLQAVTAFTYIDELGDEVTIDAADYTIDIQINCGWLVYSSALSLPSLMSTINAVKIQFRAGYGDLGTAVPEPIRQAMLLNISHMRSLGSGSFGLRREVIEGVGSWDYSALSEQGSSVVMTRAADALIAPYRVFG